VKKVVDILKGALVYVEKTYDANDREDYDAVVSNLNMIQAAIEAAIQKLYHPYDKRDEEAKGEKGD
jgi:23S rRNA A2030 N6-methylase RlmJ